MIISAILDIVCVAMKCGVCDADEEMPFTCRYCRGMFCSVHRLPPNHRCVMLHKFLEQPARDAVNSKAGAVADANGGSLVGPKKEEK